MSLVSIEQLTVSFGRGARTVHAVRDVTLAIDAGETIAVVGQSGSGKTTVARCLAGLQRPTSGQVTVDGRTWAERSAAERLALRRDVQYIPQDALSALDPQQTAFEHVVETLQILGRRPRTDAEARALSLLETLGLQHRASALPREMSGGEQRRVTLARVLALSPRLVVADEPTSGLEPDRQDQVLADLFGNLPPGSGCVMVTHDMRQARRWCRRAVVMLEGRVIEAIPFPDGRPHHPYARQLFDPWSDEAGES
ncbi:MAG: dipeptide/oligopeptide/nickel ABC transporter ATP-binding protein [Myxococcota bacterium]